MKSFEYFDHTADTLFRAYGKDFQEALANTILAVYNVIVDTNTIMGVTEKSFAVTASKQETLVYDLVEELLFLLDTESFLCHKVRSCVVTEENGLWRAVIVLIGDTDASQYDVFGQIKSPTYNEMLIVEDKDKFFIQAVLDL